MATVEHKGSFTAGAVVVYTGYGTNYGYSLVKEIYIDAIGEYRWIAEPVKIVGNEVVKYTNVHLELISDKYINDECKSRWTKDPEYKKGDILIGESSDGTRVVLLYISETRIERLTPLGKDAHDGFTGYGTLAFYRNKLKDVRVLKTSLDMVKFSEV